MYGLGLGFGQACAWRWPPGLARPVASPQLPQLCPRLVRVRARVRVRVRVRNRVKVRDRVMVRVRIRVRVRAGEQG